MPLARPRVNSLQLSIERICSTSTWRPARPPTPRRSTYPQPGTTSLSTGLSVEIEVPPVPAVSYWEPDTPSPVSPWNPFLFSPTRSPGSSREGGSPSVSTISKIMDSPRSLFSPRLTPFVSPLVSPRFMNPRTPPALPHTATDIAPAPAPASASASTHSQRRHSTTSSIPNGDLQSRRHDSLRALLAGFQDKVLTEMKPRSTKEKEDCQDSHLSRYYNKVKTRRAHREAVRRKDFQIPRDDRRLGVAGEACRGGSNGVVGIQFGVGG